MSSSLFCPRLSSIPTKYSALGLVFRCRALEIQRKQFVVSGLRSCPPGRSYSEISRHDVDDHNRLSDPHGSKKTSAASVIPPGPLSPHAVSIPFLGELGSQSAKFNANICACQSRTIVLCFDGTDEQFDMNNSNVINFFSALHKGDSERQVAYYQSGFGTFTIPQVVTPLYKEFKKILDLLFAWSMNHHVMSGYKFLMDNCE